MAGDGSGNLPESSLGPDGAGAPGAPVVASARRGVVGLLAREGGDEPTREGGGVVELLLRGGGGVVELLLRTGGGVVELPPRIGGGVVAAPRIGGGVVELLLRTGGGVVELLLREGGGVDPVAYGGLPVACSRDTGPVGNEAARARTIAELVGELPRTWCPCDVTVRGGIRFDEGGNVALPPGSTVVGMSSWPPRSSMSSDAGEAKDGVDKDDDCRPSTGTISHGSRGSPNSCTMKRAIAVLVHASFARCVNTSSDSIISCAVE